MNLFRLFKWAVCFQDGERVHPVKLPLQAVLRAQLLALIEENALRKFLVYSRDVESTEEALLVSDGRKSHMPADC